MPVAYPVSRAALDCGSLERVIALAREMPPMRLNDAMRVVLVMRDGSERRYEAACVRWLGRFALEGKGVTIPGRKEAAEVLGYLRQAAAAAMEQLLALVAHGLARPSASLISAPESDTPCSNR